MTSRYMLITEYMNIYINEYMITNIEILYIYIILECFIF